MNRDGGEYPGWGDDHGTYEWRNVVLWVMEEKVCGGGSNEKCAEGCATCKDDDESNC